MRKVSIFAIFASLALIGGQAYAANVHVKAGPFFIDNGLTLTAAGTLAGLGFQDIVVGMTARANPIILRRARPWVMITDPLTPRSGDPPAVS